MQRMRLAGKLWLAILPLATLAILGTAYFGWTVLQDAATPASRTRVWVVIGIGAVALLMASAAAFATGNAVVRRVQTVTDAARRIADVDLPNMVDALRNPQQTIKMPEAITPLEASESDEVGELARSFGALHSTLIEVAGQQMEILRKGVSDIFVTLARRNQALVDRQLALIDQLESAEEDPEILGGYYRLDHLATRMRRNAESLLVLAGTDSPRVWAKPLAMSDVVRAALGEVDDYQRVDVLALEPARVSGSVVTDLAHLLSELLDNATQYSPPAERVRITGLFERDGYLLTISDGGIGLSQGRLAELNRMLESPPVLGLALEPTLGMYVVARLAARHNVSVELVPGVPGTTARITIPRSLLEATIPVPVADDEAEEDEERRPLPHQLRGQLTEHDPALNRVVAPTEPYAFRAEPTPTPVTDFNGSSQPTEPPQPGPPPAAEPPQPLPAARAGESIERSPDLPPGDGVLSRPIGEVNGLPVRAVERPPVEAMESPAPTPPPAAPTPVAEDAPPSAPTMELVGETADGEDAAAPHALTDEVAGAPMVEAEPATEEPAEAEQPMPELADQTTPDVPLPPVESPAEEPLADDTAPSADDTDPSVPDAGGQLEDDQGAPAEQAAFMAEPIEAVQAEPAVSSEALASERMSADDPVGADPFVAAEAEPTEMMAVSDEPPSRLDWWNTPSQETAAPVLPNGGTNDVVALENDGAEESTGADPLPKRSPGMTFRDREDGRASATQSKFGASGIRAALTAYRSGQQSAGEEESDE